MSLRDASQLSERLLDHLGLIVSLATATFIGMRVLGLAWFDAPTALAIIQSGGAASITIGAAVVTLAQVVSGSAVALGLVLLLPPSRDRPRAYQAVWIAWAPLTALALVIGMWTAGVLALILGAAAAVRQAVRKRRRRRKPDEQTPDDSERKPRPTHPYRLLFPCLAFTGWLISTSLLPWLPPERIETRDDPLTTAYVLSETDSTLVILRHNDRSVERIDKPDLVQREVCDAYSKWSDTLMRLLRPTNYAKCPKTNG